MRILMVGAGAIGGYFGARLSQAGRDVTFLVRPQRAAALRERGLRVRSPLGDVAIEAPVLLTAGASSGPFDAIVVTCKAYDLPSVLDEIAPFAGGGTAVLPLLNGMAHLDALDSRFGASRVLGGQCVIAATMTDDGTIVHLNDQQSITFGERAGGVSPRVDALRAAFEGTGIPATASAQILQDMWEKWVFLASLAAGTCLGRAPVGAILAAPGGAALLTALSDECRAVAAADGFAPRPPAVERVRAMLGTAGSPLTASMLRDMDGGRRIEADHVIGDLLRRGTDRSGQGSYPMLSLAYTVLKAYENRRSATR